MFGIFGHGNVTGIGQALEEVGVGCGARRSALLPRSNEQAMVHTAVAYAKDQEPPAAFACTSSIGPGATNMLTGAALATVNRLPVLLLPGDIFASRRPDPVLQQLEHTLSPDISVNDCFRPVSRFWDRVYRPEQIPTRLPEAIRVLTDPAETGTVTLALPQDVQTEAWDLRRRALFARRVWHVPATGRWAALARASDRFGHAQRPLLVAGEALFTPRRLTPCELAAATGVPVASRRRARGPCTYDHPRRSARWRDRHLRGQRSPATPTS